MSIEKLGVVNAVEQQKKELANIKLVIAAIDSTHTKTASDKAQHERLSQREKELEESISTAVQA